MAVVNCHSCGRRTPEEDLEATGFRCECGSIIPPEARRPNSSRSSPRLTSSWGVFDWYRAIKWVFAAIVFIGLGIFLIASPEIRTNPKELTFSDAMPGIAAILAGCGMLAVIVIGRHRR